MQTNFYQECKIQNQLSLQSLFTFSRRKFEKDYLFKGERHDFTEIVCVIDGKAGITADNNVHILSAGQLIVHEPNEFHKIWSDGEEVETVIFSFRATNFPSLQSKVFILSPEQISEIKNIFHSAEKCLVLSGNDVKEIKPEMQLHASLLIKRLELFLLSVFTSNKVTNAKYLSRSAENYTRILSVMQSNLYDALTATEIAKKCNMSVPAIEKTMIKFTGKSAIAYYNDMKMKRAIELLNDGASVKEAALTLGFSNQNYFSARFKKWSGENPSAFKRL